VDEYDGLVSEALGQLHPASAATVTAMAALADDIRGYEDVKRRNIDRFRGRAAELVAELGAVEVADDSYRHHHHMAG
jgi:indolepyruvate ferredoxin oxidoreductase